MLCPEGSFLVPEIGILFGDAVGGLPCNLCFGGEGGDAGPVTCTCASSGVQEVVVWTAFTSACHQKGLFLGPKKARKIRDANTGLPCSRFLPRMLFVLK